MVLLSELEWLVLAAFLIIRCRAAETGKPG